MKALRWIAGILGAVLVVALLIRRSKEKEKAGNNLKISNEFAHSVTPAG